MHEVKKQNSSIGSPVTKGNSSFARIDQNLHIFSPRTFLHLKRKNFSMIQEKGKCYFEDFLLLLQHPLEGFVTQQFFRQASPSALSLQAAMEAAPASAVVRNRSRTTNTLKME